MSNGNIFERLWKLWAVACKLVLDGKRAPEQLAELLQKFIDTPMSNPTLVPVWKTVKLGTCKTSDKYRKALQSAGMRISEWGDDILGRITCSQEEIDLDLVVLSVAELGFREGAFYTDICAKAQGLGFDLCPAEVGPALRLQYGDQPKGSWLCIAIEAISGRYGYLGIFNVEHDGDGLWLRGHDGPSGPVWHAVNRFVFVRRKWNSGLF